MVLHLRVCAGFTTSACNGHVCSTSATASCAHIQQEVLGMKNMTHARKLLALSLSLGLTLARRRHSRHRRNMPTTRTMLPA